MELNECSSAVYEQVKRLDVSKTHDGLLVPIELLKLFSIAKNLYARILKQRHKTLIEIQLKE